MKIYEAFLLIMTVIIVLSVGYVVLDKVTSEAILCDELYGMHNWTYATWNGTDYQPGLWIDNKEQRCIYNGTEPLTITCQTN